jgi:hypothetical protein
MSCGSGSLSQDFARRKMLYAGGIDSESDFGSFGGMTVFDDDDERLKNVQKSRNPIKRLYRKIVPKY